MRSKINSWGGKTTLGELGIDQSEIDILVEKTVESGFVGFSVKNLEASDIKEILMSVL